MPGIGIRIAVWSKKDSEGTPPTPTTTTADSNTVRADSNTVDASGGTI